MMILTGHQPKEPHTLHTSDKIGVIADDAQIHAIGCIRRNYGPPAIAGELPGVRVGFDALVEGLGG